MTARTHVSNYHVKLATLAGAAFEETKGRALVVRSVAGYNACSQMRYSTPFACRRVVAV